MMVPFYILLQPAVYGADVIASVAFLEGMADHAYLRFTGITLECLVGLNWSVKLHSHYECQVRWHDGESEHLPLKTFSPQRKQFQPNPAEIFNFQFQREIDRLYRHYLRRECSYKNRQTHRKRKTI